MEDIWSKLYNEARKVQNSRVISPFIEAGGVAAAILTKAGNIYVGVCIDTASTLGMCAERNAIANMITHGEHQIDKVVAVVEDGSVGSPCGACREYMMQLDKDSGDIEILVDYESRKTVRLKELIPDWWGSGRFEKMKNMSDISDFKVFCIEAYCAEKKMTEQETMQLFKKYGVLDYLGTCYDVLHTQGRLYIVEDIDEFINIRKNK